MVGAIERMTGARVSYITAYETDFDEDNQEYFEYNSSASDSNNSDDQENFFAFPVELRSKSTKEGRKARFEGVFPSRKPGKKTTDIENKPVPLDRPVKPIIEPVSRPTKIRQPPGIPVSSMPPHKISRIPFDPQDSD